jgi:hypothetical protein
MRSLLRTVVAAVAVLSLTGCIKYDVDAKINKDTTLDGKLVVGLSSAVLSALPTEGKLSGKAKFQKDLKADFKKLPKGVTGKLYDKGGFLGAEYAFKSLPAAAILDLGDSTTSALDEPSSTSTKSKDSLVIKKVGDKITFRGVVDLGAGTASLTGTTEPGLGDVFSSAEVRFRFTFPGKVTKSNGKISGKTVTWTPKFGRSVTMTAEAKAS